MVLWALKNTMDGKIKRDACLGGLMHIFDSRADARYYRKFKTNKPSFYKVIRVNVQEVK